MPENPLPKKCVKYLILSSGAGLKEFARMRKIAENRDGMKRVAR